MLNKRIKTHIVRFKNTMLHYRILACMDNFKWYRTLQMEQKQQLILRIILIFYIIPSILSAKTI